MPELNQWQQILTHLKARINPESLKTWLGPVSMDPESNGSLILRVPNEEFHEWIEEHYHDHIVDSIRALKLPIKEIEFRSRASEAPAAPAADPEPAAEEESKSIDACPAVPESAWFELARRYRDVVGGCTEASDNYHYICFLTMAACGLGKSVYTSMAGPLFPNLFAVVVGDSSWARKTVAMRFAMWAALESAPHVIALSSIDSGEGLSSAVQRGMMKDSDAGKGSAMIQLDEFNAMLNKGNIKGSSIIPMMKQVFDYKSPLQLNRSKDWIEIQNPPVFSFLAGSETEDLADLSPRDVRGGFCNRFLFIPGLRKQLNDEAPDPKEDRRWAPLMRELRRSFEYWHSQGSSALPLSPKAKALWKDFYRGAADRGSDDLRVSRMCSRHAPYVRKISLIIAALEQQSMVHRSHMQSAISFMDFCLDSLYFTFRGVGLNPWVKEVNDIVDYVKAKKELPYRDLFTRFHRLGPERFERHMRSLLADEKNLDRLLRKAPVLNEKTGRYRTMVFLNR